MIVSAGVGCFRGGWYRRLELKLFVELVVFLLEKI